jgi:murein DD-endopeptidase MepM/ murein hydrolase activator NlpD
VNSPNTIGRDFKSMSFEHKKNLQRKRRRRPLLIGAVSFTAIVTLAVIAPTIATATKGLITTKTNPVALSNTGIQQIHASLALPEVVSSETPINEPIAVAELQPGKLHTTKIRRGDSLSTVFDRIGLPPSQIQAVMATGTDSKVLTRLHPGDQVIIYTSPDNRQLRGLMYDIDETHRLEIAQGSTGLNSQIIESPIETRITHATGMIDSSLFVAAQQTGLSDNLTMELANLFGWDVDFALDIRAGDQFSLVYEEQYLHGEKLRDGNILAAEFINQNRSYRAVRFTDSNNRVSYYTPDGKSVRKAFLRTPVDFKRISSRFNPHRKHPKLNLIRAHKGVDYAAARGTPIRATGDGKVILRGTKGGYGRTVIIQHGTKYSTLYAHMNSYARGIRNGSKVRQGQTIGYVGSSGLATGPHLHYEFRLNGAHRNPLTVHLPDAAPLPKQYLSTFNNAAQPLLAQLDTLKRTTLALYSQ